MIKVQTLTPDLGWVFSTRAGELPAAWGVLAGYRKRWPNEQHRLVHVSDKGEVTIIPDDDAAIAVFSDE
ncbi:MAG: hypothetical protein VB131_05625 [Burkholderia gladioli]